MPALRYVWLTILTSLVIFFPGAAFAATRTWDSEGGDNNCSTAANWSDDTAPISTDDVVINSTADTITWDSSCTQTVGSLLIDTGFTGTVQVNTTYTGGAFDLFTITNDLTINAGTMTHAQNTTAATYRLSIAVGGNLTVGENGAINVNGKGYYHGADYGPIPAGYGPGAPTTRWQAGGGGYGGQGGYDTWSGPGGKTYGSITAPTDIGSTGAINVGGPTAGGGAFLATVTGATIVNGVISANGYAITTVGPWGNAVGGGSGGSSYISTGSFGGSGTISVNGGYTYGCCGGGGGGGGRMAIILTNSSTFGDVTLTANGGGFRDYWDYTSGNDAGASGTIYLQTQDQTNQTGWLIVPTTYVYYDAALAVAASSSTVIPDTTEYPVRYSYAVLSDLSTVSYSFGSVTVRDRGSLKTDSNDSLTLASGGTFSVATSGALINNGTLTLGGTTFTNSGTFTSTASTSTVTYTGNTNDALVTMIPSTYYNLVVNNTGSTFNQGGATTVTNSLTITNGTYDLNGYNLTNTNIFTVGSGKTLQLQGNETVSVAPTLATGSTVVYDGTSSYDELILGDSYKNLTVSGSGIWELDAPLAVSGDLAIGGTAVLDLSSQDLIVSYAYRNNSILRLNGDETVSLTNDTDSGETRYDGTSSYTSLPLGSAYYDLAFYGTGSFDPNVALTVSGSLTVSGASLNLSGYSISIEDTLNNRGTITLNNDETVSVGTIDTSNGTVIYRGSGSYASFVLGNTYAGLQLTGAGAVFTLSQGLTTSATLSLASSVSLSLSSYTLSATSATLTNLGLITLDTGILYHTPNAFSFADSSYAAKSSFTTGDPAYITLSEGDENLDGTTIETVSVTLTTAGGDSETLTLTESSAFSGIFRGSMNTGEVNSEVHTGNNIIEVLNDASTTMTASFTDSNDSVTSTTSATLTGAAAETTTSQSGGGGGAGGSRRSGVIRSQSLPMLSERRFTTGEIVSAKQQGEEGQSYQQQPSLAPWLDFSPSHPFAEAALTLYNAGIVKGNDNGTVRLDRSISRIEALTLLTRTLGAEPRPGTQLSFTDIDPSSWYAEPLRIAIAKKIIKGFPDGTFRPAEPLNIVQSLKLICISLGLASQEDEQRAFQWYDPYVTVGREHGLIQGAIDPANPVTRGEFFEWLVKVLENGN